MTIDQIKLLQWFDARMDSYIAELRGRHRDDEADLVKKKYGDLRNLIRDLHDAASKPVKDPEQEKKDKLDEIMATFFSGK
jgi:hypothetical protein